MSRQVLAQSNPSGLVSTETILSTTHSGPIPNPEIIAGYEKVLSGSADRIIKMAEKEQDQRHKLQSVAQGHLAKITFLGQILAFLMGLSGIAGGVFLAMHDKPVSGFGVFITSLGTLVGLFLVDRRQHRPPPSK
jgi:uncharacterized membrane protein